ncbi:magnesium transporter [Streptomyces sp. DconLS]|nr:magnesium transporter [Streptomyces sp. DconLS]
MEFRRATGPLTVPLNRLAGTGPLGSGSGVPFVHEDARPFFRDVGDHLARVNESVEGLDRLVSDVLSAHLAQTSVRQNDDMRKISAWAAMAAVPTMIAGIYGMNFDHMPELHWLWSYPVVILVMALLEVLLYRLFKRREWL